MFNPCCCNPPRPTIMISITFSSFTPDEIGNAPATTSGWDGSMVGTLVYKEGTVKGGTLDLDYDPNAGLVFFAVLATGTFYGARSDGGVSRVKDDGTGYTRIVAPTAIGSALCQNALCVDKTSQTVYFATDPAKIWSCDYNGGSLTNIYTAPFTGSGSGINGLAVDHDAGYLFWSEWAASSTTRLMRSDLSGGSATALYGPSSTPLIGVLDVDPGSQMIFFEPGGPPASFGNSTGYIAKVAYDGSGFNATAIHVFGRSKFPSQGFCVDPVNGLVYIGIDGNSTMFRSGLDGSNPLMAFFTYFTDTTGGPYPSGGSLFGLCPGK